MNSEYAPPSPQILNETENNGSLEPMHWQIFAWAMCWAAFWHNPPALPPRGIFDAIGNGTHTWRENSATVSR
jgi:hypothetical protein